MYVCICNAVTESDIREAVVGGARSLAELSARTGCSNTCGTCAEVAEEVLSQALRQHRPVSLRLVGGSQFQAA